MALFQKNHKNPSSKSRSQKETQKKSLFNTVTDPSQLLRVALFFVFCFFITLICFVGQFPSGLQVLPNQIAKIRITAEFPFSYISDIQTNRKAELIRKQIAPVYSIDNKSFTTFSSFINDFLHDLDQLQSNLKQLPPSTPPEEINFLIETLSNKFKDATGTYLAPDDISLIVKKIDTATRKKIISEGLMTLSSITREGIFKPLDSDFSKPEPSAEGFFFYGLEIEGKSPNSKIQTENEALRALSLNISAMDIDWNLSRAIYRLLKPGIKPNLIYDVTKSNEKVEHAIKSMSPIITEVQQGQTIIEPGSIVGPEQMEQLQAYHEFIKTSEDASLGFDITLRERSILTLVLMFTAILYLRIAQPKVIKSNKRLALAALVLILNLLAIRLVLELGDINLLGKNPTILSVLPFAAPIAFGAMIITIMINPRLATVVGALTSTFYALMLGSITSFLLIGLLAALVGIYFCRNVRLRADVVRSGIYTGLSIALASFFFGIFNETPINTILYQTLFALLTGAMSGLIVIGILPSLEKLFNITTNITLLELTDFNHPLLRRLQIEAPGTYHHSIMVANLAEQAAAEIKANPLLCHVTALFHDIGKLVKPEYFVENQSEGINPHIERNPSMSALVIKSHVSEGVELAKDYKLPTVIVDVIKQHHGTSLIRYFYDKALKQNRQTQLPFSDIEALTATPNSKVEESSFRYEGPPPQFKECAIVSFADSLEAASRSLKKVSATSIKALIDSIFKEKIDDHQMDFCHLTLNEINLLKKSFAFTLLNMLHSRIEYPGKDKPSSSENQPSSNEPNDISRYSSH